MERLFLSLSLSFIDKMKTPQEKFDQGVKLRLAGNEDFKKQDYKGGKSNKHVSFIISEQAN